MIQRTANRLLLALLAFSLGAALPGCSKQITDDDIEYMSVTDLHRRLTRDPNKNLPLDARSREEFATERIPGARHIRSTDVDVQDPDPALRGYSALIVYGENPGTSNAAAITKRLMIANFKSVFLLEGGMDAWRRAGLPVDDAAR